MDVTKILHGAAATAQGSFQEEDLATNSCVTLSGNPDYSFCGIKISIRAIVI